MTDSVLGFYVPKQNRLVIGSVDGAMQPMDEMTLAHELTHAVTDQTLPFPKLGSKDPMKSDQLLARRSVIEGDATLLEMHYMTAAFTMEQKIEIANSFQDAASGAEPSMNKVPYVFRKTMEFPYNEGFAFTCRALLSGGWGAVDNLYMRPPSSSAQVIFPERYDNDVRPIDAPGPAPLEKGWEKVRAMSLGATDLLWMFQSAKGTEPSASEPDLFIEKVKGWNGGELHAYQRDGATAVQFTVVDGGVSLMNGKTSWSMCSHIQHWFEDAFPEAKQIKSHGAIEWRNAGQHAALSCVNKIARFATSTDRRATLRLVSSK
jgi:hypothetical protein